MSTALISIVANSMQSLGPKSTGLLRKQRNGCDAPTPGQTIRTPSSPRRWEGARPLRLDGPVSRVTHRSLFFRSRGLAPVLSARQHRFHRAFDGGSAVSVEWAVLARRSRPGHPLYQISEELGVVSS